MHQGYRKQFFSGQANQLQSWVYNYIGGSRMCMLILCCCICSIFGSWLPQSNSWEKLLLVSLPSSRRGYPDLAKYRTVWVTFCSYYLLDAFLLACAFRIASAYIRLSVRHHDRFLANYVNHLNSLIVERSGFILTECTSFFPEWLSFQYGFVNSTSILLRC